MQPARGAGGALYLAESERLGQEGDRRHAVLVEQIWGNGLRHRASLPDEASA
jgi:hypothetical protein